MSQVTGNINLVAKLLGFEKFVTASSSITGFNNSLNGLQQQLSVIKKPLEELQTGFSNFTNGLKGIAELTVGKLGFDRLIQVFDALRDSFEEVQTQSFLLKQSLVNINAGQNFDKVEKFARDFTKNIAITLPEAFFALSRIIEASGNSEEEFLRKSLTAVKNLAVFYNGDLNRAVTNFNRIFTNALNQLGKDFPRLRILREVLGDTLFRSGAAADFLNQQLGQLAETYAAANKGSRELADNQLRFSEQMLKLGEIISNFITPIIINFKRGISDLVIQIKPETLNRIQDVLKGIANTIGDLISVFVKFNKEIAVAAVTLLLFFRPSVSIGAFDKLKAFFDFKFTTKTAEVIGLNQALKGLSASFINLNNAANLSNIFKSARTGRLVDAFSGTFLSKDVALAVNNLKQAAGEGLSEVQAALLATTANLQNLGFRGLLPLRAQNKVFRELAETAGVNLDKVNKQLRLTETGLTNTQNSFVKFGNTLKATSNVGVAGLTFRAGQLLNKSEADAVTKEIQRIEDKVTSLNLKFKGVRDQFTNITAAVAATNTSIIDLITNSILGVGSFVAKTAVVAISIQTIRVAIAELKANGENLLDVFDNKTQKLILTITNFLNIFSVSKMTSAFESVAIVVQGFTEKIQANVTNLSTRTKFLISQIISQYRAGVLSFSDALSATKRLIDKDIEDRRKAIDAVTDQQLVDIEDGNLTPQQKQEQKENLEIIRQASLLEQQKTENIKNRLTTELQNQDISRKQNDLQRDFITGQIDLNQFIQKRIELVKSANKEQLDFESLQVKIAENELRRLQATVPGSRTKEEDERVLAATKALNDALEKEAKTQGIILNFEKETNTVLTQTGLILQKIALDLSLNLDKIKQGFGSREIFNSILVARNELNDLAVKDPKAALSAFIELKNNIRTIIDAEIGFTKSQTDLANSVITRNITLAKDNITRQLELTEQRFTKGFIPASVRDERSNNIRNNELLDDKAQKLKELDLLQQKLAKTITAPIRDQERELQIFNEIETKKTEIAVIDNKIQTNADKLNDTFTKQQQIIDDVTRTLEVNKDNITKLNEDINLVTTQLNNLKIIDPDNFKAIQELENKLKELIDIKGEINDLETQLVNTRFKNLFDAEIIKVRSGRLIEELNRSLATGQVNPTEFLSQKIKIDNVDLDNQIKEVNRQILVIKTKISENDKIGVTKNLENIKLNNDLLNLLIIQGSLTEKQKENALFITDIYHQQAIALEQINSKLEPLLLKLGSFPGGLIQQILGNPDDASLISEGIREVGRAVDDLKVRFAGNFDDPEFIKALNALEAKLLEIKEHDIGFKVGRSIREGLETGIGDALEKIIVNGEKVGEVFRKLAADIIITAAKMLANEAVKQFFRIALSLFLGASSNSSTLAGGESGSGFFAAEGGIIPGSYAGVDDTLVMAHKGEGFIPAPRLRDEGSRSVFELLRTGFGPLIASRLGDVPRIRPFSPRFSFDQGGIVGPGTGTQGSNIVRALIGDDEIARFVRTPTFFKELQKIHQEKGRQLLGQ